MPLGTRRDMDAQSERSFEGEPRAVAAIGESLHVPHVRDKTVFVLPQADAPPKRSVAIQANLPGYDYCRRLTGPAVGHTAGRRALEGLHGLSAGVVVVENERSREVGAEPIEDVQDERVVSLTKREIEVLSLVLEGKSSREVAATLVCSKRTVDFHLARIYEKLQVSNRVQAMRRAALLGLVDVPFAGKPAQN
ncbi:MAG: helix-turn-helix domain-containing protein [Armatimonadota bacterium]